METCQIYTPEAEAFYNALRKGVELFFRFLEHLRRKKKAALPFSHEQSPTNSCQTIHPKTGRYCRGEPTHLYAPLLMCTACAEKWIAMGANPPPVRMSQQIRSQCGLR